MMNVDAGTILGASLSLATFGAGLTAKAVWTMVGSLQKGNGNGKKCEEHKKLVESNEKLVVLTTEINTMVKGLVEKDNKEHDEIFVRLRKAENRVSVLSDREQING